MDKRVGNGKDTRRKHSAALKRDLVERSVQPGASVAALAQAHGINANLLFNWRRLHLRALRADAGSAAVPTLLPVTVRPDPPLRAQTTSPPAAPAAPVRGETGFIEIEIGTARVRLRGPVDDACVRSVLRALSELA